MCHEMQAFKNHLYPKLFNFSHVFIVFNDIRHWCLLTFASCSYQKSTSSIFLWFFQHISFFSIMDTATGKLPLWCFNNLSDWPPNLLVSSTFCEDIFHGDYILNAYLIFTSHVFCLLLSESQRSDLYWSSIQSICLFLCELAKPPQICATTLGPAEFCNHLLFY